jgi:hypothetical protein
VAGRNDLGRGGRFLAACLAGIWLAAGSLTIVVGVRHQSSFLLIILGVLAVGYGWVWARVALTGQRQRWVLGRGSATRDRH